MIAEEFFIKKKGNYNLDNTVWSGENMIQFAKDFASEKCKEQREICYKNLCEDNQETGDFTMMPIITLVKNAEEPEF